MVDCGVMDVFIGEYRHNLDAKGRIIIPVKFREELGDLIIVTRGLDGCLSLYTQDQWKRLYATLRKLPSTKKESRMYIHMITAKACECELDAQGRILIPSSLCSDASLKKECVIVGVGDHAEIWSKDRWDSYYEEASASFESNAEELTEYMFDETC